MYCCLQSHEGLRAGLAKQRAYVQGAGSPGGGPGGSRRGPGCARADCGPADSECCPAEDRCRAGGIVAGGIRDGGVAAAAGGGADDGDVRAGGRCAAATGRYDAGWMRALPGLPRPAAPDGIERGGDVRAGVGVHAAGDDRAQC